MNRTGLDRMFSRLRFTGRLLMMFFLGLNITGPNNGLYYFLIITTWLVLVFIGGRARWKIKNRLPEIDPQMMRSR